VAPINARAWFSDGKNWPAKKTTNVAYTVQSNHSTALPMLAETRVRIGSLCCSSAPAPVLT
jgi:hypothetical protein